MISYVIFYESEQEKRIMLFKILPNKIQNNNFYPHILVIDFDLCCPLKLSRISSF